MGAVHVFLMFLLVWSVTADEDDISITCEHVTGNVGDKVTLTCRVSNQKDNCCMKLYKFKNTMSDDDGTSICKDKFGGGSCLQRTSFTCLYDAHAAMTTTFSFFLQTTCGTKTTDFTVNITGGNDFGNTVQTVNVEGGNTDEISGEKTPVPTDKIIPVIICFIVIIVGVILLILKKKHIFTNICEIQKDYNMSECSDGDLV